MNWLSTELIAVLRLYFKDKAYKISQFGSKKFDRKNRKAESTAKCWKFESIEREKLSASESEWVTIHGSESVKSVR
jgi:hypothetical protein